MPFDAISPKQSIYKLCRELKKEEHSLFNCLSSIVDDAAFCSEIRVLYPDMPLLANLRCGLWYAPRPDATCYFKSTDGHQHHHTFSTTRLNWHVAEVAARKGGCIIVDATRKGKRAPDALSKTIPIWAAVLNRAVARVRLHDAQKEQRRRSYTTLDGEVLTPVADTQTSISVRTDNPCSSSPGSSAAVRSPQLQEQQCQQQEGQQQQQQQQSAISACNTEVEELLLDCMGDSCLELLAAGPFMAVPRPGTPDQAHAQHPHSSHLQRALSYAATAGVAGSASPASRASTLHRSMSLQISPQPSLQEWLDEADVLHRLALLHHDCCRSPARRMPRISCHSIGRNGSSDANSTCGGIGEAPAVLFASSAPASSCLLGSSPPRSSGCVRALCSIDAPAAAAVPEHQPQPQQQQQCFPITAAAGAAAAGSQSESAGFSITSGGAVEPVTPRLGCCGALAATFDSIQEALQAEQHPEAAASASAGSGPGLLTQQQLHLLEPHEPQWGLPVAVSGPPTVGSAVSVKDGDFGDAAGEPGADFAFPAPHLLAQSVGSSLLEAGSSMGGPGAAAGAGTSSASSSCGCIGLPLPEMPVVVLNGTSHQPGDAASILDIWRSTDLEDVATLPGISNRPGVYHVPAEQEVDDEEAADCDLRGQQKQQPADAGQAVAQGACSDGWVVVAGQQPRAAVPAGAAASVASSTESSNSWMDEETGLGYRGLCAFAPPPLAVPAAAAADDTSSTCSVGSVARLRPSSPSACSSCSSDSELSNTSSRSVGAAAPGAAAAPADSTGAGAAAVGEAAAEAAWDTALHLPLWVPSHERQAIEAKLDSWVERLLEVGADVRGLAAQLRKPLRPLWVTQDSLIWTNQVAHPSSLPFTPLLLVSASQPRQCERQTARAFGASAAAGLGMQDLDDLSDDEVPGSSSSSSSRAAAKLGRSPGRPGSVQHSRCASNDTQLRNWSYVYVPGAGDDEESWAVGLTPALFWDNCEALLSCGPAGIAAAVKQLLAHHRSVAYGRGAGSSLGQQLLQHRACGSPPAHCVPTDQHHPAPKGCGGGADDLLAEAAAAGLKVVRAAPGAYWLGSTGLALGNLEGASAADVWRTMDAVLCCGTAMSPALQQEYQSMQLRSQRMPAVLGGSDSDTPSAVCGSAPSGRPGAWATAGLCFKPTYCWQSNSHALSPVSSSYSSCSEWARQHRQQQQQHVECASVEHGSSGAAAAEPGSDSGSLHISKLEVPPPKQAKRKGGMLTELLSRSNPTQQQLVAASGRQLGGCQAGRVRSHHTRSSSAESVSSMGSCSCAASESSVSSSDSNCSSTYYSTSSDDPAASGGPCGQNPQLPRLKWLPIECAKRDRASLKQHLQQALEFVSAHLAAGHLVLLHDVDGHDNCVCVAVAMLLACFTPPEAAEGRDAGADCGPRFVGGWPALEQQPCIPRQQQQQQLPPEPVSKHSVRQRLALVSRCYPAARPTRGSLKQVFNFFEERRRADGSGSRSGSGGGAHQRPAVPSLDRVDAVVVHTVTGCGRG